MGYSTASSLKKNQSCQYRQIVAKAEALQKGNPQKDKMLALLDLFRSSLRKNLALTLVYTQLKNFEASIILSL